MSDLDNRLTAALSADLPPARDAMFRLEVLLRIERSRLRRRVLMTLAVAFGAVALVVVNAQAVEGWIAMDIWLVWVVAPGALAAMFYLSGMPIEALPGFRGVARTIGRWLYP